MRSQDQGTDFSSTKSPSLWDEGIAIFLKSECVVDTSRRVRQDQIRA